MLIVQLHHRANSARAVFKIGRHVERIAYSHSRGRNISDGSETWAFVVSRLVPAESRSKRDQRNPVVIARDTPPPLRPEGDPFGREVTYSTVWRSSGLVLVLAIIPNTDRCGVWDPTINTLGHRLLRRGPTAAVDIAVSCDFGEFRLCGIAKRCQLPGRNSRPQFTRRHYQGVLR